MTSLAQTVGANVRRLRRNRGLSLVELGQHASVAKGTLTQLEAGRGNPTLETVQSLGRALGLSLAGLPFTGNCSEIPPGIALPSISTSTRTCAHEETFARSSEASSPLDGPKSARGDATFQIIALPRTSSGALSPR